MNAKTPLREFGAFLRTRRSQLSPAAVGLRERASLRRVRGLRREEVAQLAAISTDYYTRLEQGRLPASAPVLDTLARVLHLDDAQRTYLFELAGRQAAVRPRAVPQRVRPQMQRLLDHLVDIPAMVQNRRFDILAWNPMAAALMVDFAEVPKPQRNYVRLVFTHPAMRTLYPDWDRVGRLCVALLRMEAAENPTDPRLAALVGELSVQSLQFREWWAAHDVATKGNGTRVFHHPIVGPIALEWDTLVSTSDRSQELVVWTAESGSPSAAAMHRLREVATQNRS